MTVLLRQSIRFGTVGLANTAIGLTTIYALMYFFEAGPATANAVGYVAGLATSFAINRSWTFGSDLPSSDLLPNYLLVAAVSYLLNLGAVVADASLFLVNPYLAQVMGVGIYAVCMFFGCRWFVFTPRRLKRDCITITAGD